ncbi:hypothetical protein HPB48_003442 [Haemaphysalis longicornis]|uniref:Uncharacterized protein n=1 Tax=Haemaphysalis longicornis TaxID=44386 RepID=A0A9J6GAP8_HAELO|nr:hypothetical protein HPB48_003442 [Haemaphysalis longicornis]
MLSRSAKSKTSISSPRSSSSQPPCYTSQYGLLDIASIRRMKFVELFRFGRDDIDEFRTLLRVPDEVVSAQRVTVTGIEALCMTAAPRVPE